MTPAYPATLTFPTAALELVPIREWIQCPDAGAMVATGPTGLTSVRHGSAEAGSFSLLSLLDGWQVPYDHTHEDPRRGTFTVHVRFDHCGGRREHVVQGQPAVSQATAVTDILTDLRADNAAGAMAGYAQWLHERESQAEPLFAAASTWRPAPADRPSDHSRTGVADAVMRAIFR